MAGDQAYSEFLQMQQVLERRGAKFLKVESHTWRIHIPTHLELEPFSKFLAEQDCIYQLGAVKVLYLSAR